MDGVFWGRWDRNSGVIGLYRPVLLTVAGYKMEGLVGLKWKYLRDEVLLISS